ncbi:MAG: hypothetical protein Q7S60_00850 [bacterium]|nr:hypothetical protein [bacterium]
MFKLSKYKRLDKVFLYLSSLFLVLFFAFSPHYVELTGVLETWFPYKGLIPYKEFAAYHFPLGRWILLPLHLASNWNLELDPFVALVFGLGTLVLIYKFGKRFLSPVGTSISLFFFAAFFWFAATGILFYHEMLIGFLLALILYILLIKEKNLTSGRLFVLGLLISLAELSGQIATITLAIIFLYIVVPLYKKRGGIAAFLGQLGYFMLGLLVPLVIISLYFIKNNAFGEFFYYNIVYYVQYSGYKRNLLSLPFQSLAAFYLPLILLLTFRFPKLVRNRKNFPLYIFFLLLSLSTIPFIIFSVYHPHHLSYALPILAISAGLSYDTMRYSGVGKSILTIALMVFLSLFFTNILPWHTLRMALPITLKIANDTYPGDEMYPVVNWIKENTPEDAKILVLADGLLYFRSNRLPSARPSKGIPYSWEPFDKVKIELQTRPPSYWIIGKTFTSRLIKDFNKGYMIDFVNRELNTCYKLKFEYEVWQIWEKSKKEKCN